MITKTAGAAPSARGISLASTNGLRFSIRIAEVGGKRACNRCRCARLRRGTLKHEARNGSLFFRKTLLLQLASQTLCVLRTTHTDRVLASVLL